jgi:hypothetical protein
MLGGSWPAPVGWGLAVVAVPTVLLIDTGYKTVRRRR